MNNLISDLTHLTLHAIIVYGIIGAYFVQLSTFQLVHLTQEMRHRMAVVKHPLYKNNITHNVQTYSVYMFCMR